jgi:hypothetical protein
MKRALLYSCNLVGDGLYIGPVAKRWYETKGKDFDEVYLQTCPNHAVDIYKGMGVPWQVVTERDSGPYDYEFKFDAGLAFELTNKKRCHLMTAYADMMGVNVAGLPFIPNYQPPEIEIPDDLKNRILVSHVSFSGTDIKAPRTWEHWRVLLDTMKEAYPDSKFGILGGKDEKIYPEMGVPEDEYLLGLSMAETALAMRHSKCVLTIDNGMAHLAASQKANQFYLAAWVLHLYFVLPWGNPNLRVWHFDPNTYDIYAVNEALKSSIRDWKAA